MSNFAIETVNLTKQFGHFTAVDQLNLEIPEKGVFGFLGPNGAGKTTAINMISGLSKPTVGDVFIFGEKIKNNADLKTMIGISPQENIFWPKLTCREQLVFMAQMYGFTLRHAKKNADHLLEITGLKEKSNILASKLSGGMQRRLNICLALVHDPKIIILDEPEAGLDPQSRILVRDMIHSLSEDKTVILTTHNMDEADRLSQMVAIIDYGKLLKSDSPENLKKSIGEGDILEVEISEENPETVEKVTNELMGICKNVKFTRSVIIFKAKHLLELIPEISQKLKNSGIKILEIKMRENTLEDVFIYLTGRRLRQ